MKPNSMQKKIFKKNMRLLAEKFPRIYEVVKDTNCDIHGEFKLVETGIYNFHYREKGLMAYNSSGPSEEAKPLVQKINKKRFPVAVSLGLGLGWIQMKLAEKFASLPQIIVEPSYKHFKLALFSTDLSKLLKNRLVDLVVGDFEIKKFEKRFKKYAYVKEIEVIIHGPSTFLFPERYKKMTEEIDNFLTSYIVNQNTLEYFSNKTLTNRIENLELLPWLKHSAYLKNAFRDIPAILVAAGPSLSQSLDFLKEISIKKSAILFCVDAALPVLKKNRITPHFVSSLDPSTLTLEKYALLTDNKLEETNLLFLPRCCPDVPRRLAFKNKIVVAENHGPDFWIWDSQGITNPENFLTDSMSTVAHLNLSMSLFMGCNPIFMVGQDFCYWPNGMDHAEGVSVSQKVAKNAKPLKEKTIYGETVFTDFAWIAAKNNMEGIIKKNSDGRLIFNLSRGLDIKGATPANFQEGLKRLGKGKVNDEVIYDNLDQEKHDFSSKSLIISSNKIINDITKVQGNIKKITKEQYIDFENNNVKRRLEKRIGKILKFRYLWNIIAEVTRGEHVFKEIGTLDRTIKENKIRKQSISALLSFFKESNQILTDLKKRLEDLRDFLQFLENEDVTMTDLFRKGIFFPISDEKFNEEFACVSKASLGFTEELENFATYCKKSPYLRNIIPELASPWLESLEWAPFHPVTQRNIKRLNILRQVDQDFVKKKSIDLWENNYPKIRLPEHIKYVEWWKPLSDILPPSYRRMEVACRLFRKHPNRDDFHDFIEYVTNSKNCEPADLELAARIFLKLEHYDKAILFLEKATRQAPECAMLWEEIGDILLSGNDFEGALIAYERCAQSLPNYLLIYKKIGEIYYKIGLVELATKTFKLGLSRMKEGAKNL